MKYYLIAGEASGDLHASRLMRSLKAIDAEAEFRFIGGDQMIGQGGTCVFHFKDIAYMGLVPVLMHLRTILKARTFCKKDILEWQPDYVIFVDYAGFNLSVAKFLKGVKSSSNSSNGFEGKLVYYIAPKIWAWKEGRIKNFKRDIEQMLCIFPFEVDFFEKKHNYPVHYVGNPTNNEVEEFKNEYHETFEQFVESHEELDSRPVIAMLAGSRRQEIKDNLRMMIDCTEHLKDQYQRVLACAPSVDLNYYKQIIGDADIQLVSGETYKLLSHSTVALVTSGTATLETCCFNVPQVVLYKTPSPGWLARWVWNHLFKVKYISLVNLIANREVVSEMMADKFTKEQIVDELNSILPGQKKRARMLSDYTEIREKLGTFIASDNAANVIQGL